MTKTHQEPVKKNKKKNDHQKKNEQKYEQNPD